MLPVDRESGVDGSVRGQSLKDENRLRLTATVSFSTERTTVRVRTNIYSHLFDFWYNLDMIML